MLTSILSMACALTLNAAPMTVQADTVQVYMINEKKVAEFNGSQLVGKKVTDYRIVTAVAEKSGEVTRVHMITTDDAAAKDSKATKAVKKMVYIVNGKQLSEAQLNKLDPSTIAAMTVYKADSKEAREWTKDGSANVVVVELRDSL